MLINTNHYKITGLHTESYDLSNSISLLACTSLTRLQLSFSSKLILDFMHKNVKMCKFMTKTVNAQSYKYAFRQICKAVHTHGCVS